MDKNNKSRAICKNIIIFIITGIVFFALNMPFRKLFSVMGATEMRPSSALPPAFGLLFGIPGALGCAVANMIADYLSGDSYGVCFFGFFSQFLFGVLPIFLWKLFKGNEIRLNTLKNFGRFVATFFINAVINTVFTSLIIINYYDVKFLSLTTVFILFNNVVFGMLLGIPIIICVGYFKLKKQGCQQSLNEKLILSFLVLGIVSATLTGIFVYSASAEYVDDIVTLWDRIYFYVFIDLFIYYNVTWIALWSNEKKVTVPIEKIIKIAKNYSNSNKDHEAYAKISKECEALSADHGEIGYLAVAFKNMINSIESSVNELTEINAEKERIGTELTIAKSIQAHMLPIIFPPFPERDDIDIFASMSPAKEVGGDLYDFFFVDEKTLAIVIADVSGKGVPAALFMAVSKILIKNYAMMGKKPDEIFTMVNDQFCENNEENMFVTAWMATINLETGKAFYSNAGHNPPLISYNGNDFQFLKSRPGLVLGAMKNVKYRRNEFDFLPGDKIFLYTDGVTESNNLKNEFYGNDRLTDILNKIKKESSAEICNAVANDVDVFTKGAPQFDDITMLALSTDYLISDSKITVYPSNKSVQYVQNYIDKFSDNNKISVKQHNKLNVIIDELYSNTVKYSNASSATITAEMNADKIELVISDNGVPYNPMNAEKPDITQSSEDRKIGGLGIHIVKSMASEFTYERQNEKNIVTVVL